MRATMDAVFDTPTPRVLREEDLSSLSPQARRIAEAITQLSTATWHQVWHRHAEHRIWQAMHQDGPDRLDLGLDIAEAARLRLLAQAAGGWVAWASRPRLVAMPAWLVLHRAWVARHPD